MPTIFKNNPVLAQIDIFAIQPEQQQALVDSVIDYVNTVLKQQPGFIADAIHRSRDGERVVNYVQWKSQDDYEAYIRNSNLSLATKLSAFPTPDSHLYEIFISEPADSKMKISTDINGLINFGIFKLKKPEEQPRFLEYTQQAVQLVAGQPGLITTHFHRSLDGARAVNYGLWSSQEEYAAMNANPPFTQPLVQMRELADNEFQMSLYEVVFTEPED